ncbi:delta 1-pyrroline-5-carboxylate reductase [Pichia californica]|uniref:Pyrroline-5-carboxylate reductase n=1 Tax=Pichia californica TaxID=460514 RepID=A0A9P6WNN5_9ASCO|nr:delta 1-pyrroline-5-carboxylate reductase [[Candida] californica]KAG0690344.1 delta 1-pyrroline-5-carboxylate reductase [[Candida] californica]
MSLPESYTLTILGAGVMGSAVLSAILKSKPTPFPGKIYCCTGSQASAERLQTTYGDSIYTTYGADNIEPVRNADLIILGCKPYMCQSIIDDVKEALNDKKIVISLLAGWTIEQISVGMGTPFIARVMTNTPAKYGCGTAIVSFSPGLQGSQFEEIRKAVMALVDTVGMALELPEKNMDAATSLVGSGPAFVLLMMQALAEGGVRMGIPYEVSKKCAAKVMEGTAKMVMESGQHPEALKSMVCTPGGTTIGGLMILEDKGVRGAISRSVEEAADIAARLGKK